MIYALNIEILTSSLAALDTLIVAVPARIDSSVWLGAQAEYDVSQGLSMEGKLFFMASIRFHTAAGRQTAWDKIKSKVTPTILSKILTGSYVAFHDCKHDEGFPCITPVVVWSK